LCVCDDGTVDTHQTLFKSDRCFLNYSFYFLESKSKNLTVPNRSPNESSTSENGRQHLNAKLYKKHSKTGSREQGILNFETKKLIAESLVKSNRISEMNGLLNDSTKSTESSSNLNESNGASHKIPSYIGISCAISGYSTYSNRYKESNSPSNQVKRLNDNTLLSTSIHNSSLISTMSTKPSGNQFLDMNRTIESYNSFKNNLNRFNNLSNHANQTKPRQPPPSNHSNHFDSLDNSFLTRDRTLLNDSSSQEDDTKSLVQKRIESLYGHNFASNWKDRIERSKIKNEKVNNDSFRSPSCPPEFINNGLISSKKNLPVLKYIQNTIFNNTDKEDGPINQKAVSQTNKQHTKSEEALNSKCNGSRPIELIEVTENEPASLIHFNDEFVKDDKIDSAQSDEVESNNLIQSTNNQDNLLVSIVENFQPVTSNNSANVQKDTDEVDFMNLNAILNNTSNQEERHDGRWFLKQLDDEIGKIKDKINQIDEICLDENLHNREEIDGKIRASVGKAHLLINKKLSQFKELCNKNLTQTEDEQYKTLDKDLEGFFEMVSYQIDDIHKTFDEILFLKNNNWIVHNDLLVNPSPRKTGSKCSSRTNSNGNSRNNSKPSSRNTSKEDLRRLKLREAKRKHQNQHQTNDDIVIFLSNNKTETKADNDS